MRYPERHAKPTNAQLITRIYRRQLELAEQIAAINENVTVFKGLRMKQDEQLERMIRIQSTMLKHVDNFAYRLSIPTLLDEASLFMAKPLSRLNSASRAQPYPQAK